MRSRPRPSSATAAENTTLMPSSASTEVAVSTLGAQPWLSSSSASKVVYDSAVRSRLSVTPRPRAYSANSSRSSPTLAISSHGRTTSALR